MNYNKIIYTILGILLLAGIVAATTTITDVKITTTNVTADYGIFNTELNASGFLYVNTTNVGIGTDNSTDPLTVVGVAKLRPKGDYSGALWFSTSVSNQSFVAAPWILHINEGGTGDHDHVLVAGYNVRYNNTADAWERINNSEHCVRIGYESRYTTGDPAVKRGSFEFNIDLDRDLSGTPNFERRALFLTYDMDQNRTSFTVGDSQDSATDYFSSGIAGSYDFIFSGARNLQTMAIGSGNASWVSDATKTNRIVISTAGLSASDRAAYIHTAGGSGNYLSIDAGKDASDNIGYILIGDSRATRVGIGDTNGDVDAQLEVQTTASLVGLMVRGAASQTANLFQVTNSSEDVLARFDANGILQLKANYTSIICSSANAGMIYYDGSLNKLRVCNSTDWDNLN